MNVFLFVTANKNERTAFEVKFIRNEEKYILGKTYYLGVFGHYQSAYIHIDEQGITSPATSLLISRLTNVLHPVAVIMVGIAFGADENKQKIGDVLVSDKILPYDSQKLLENETIYKDIPKEVGYQLLNAFREYREWKYYLPNSTQSVVHIGSLLTGSRLINNYEFRKRLLNDFSVHKPIGGEMEAQGIYSVARINGVSEWIIVKGICDWGYNKDNPNKEKEQEIAANAAVNYCFYVFSRRGVFDSLIEDYRVLNNFDEFGTTQLFNEDKTAKLKLLLVDDDFYLARAYALCLNDTGIFNADYATSVDEMFRLSERKSYDIFVIDISLPKGNRYTSLETAEGWQTGLLLYTELKDKYCDSIVVALSNNFLPRGIEWFDRSDTQLFSKRDNPPEEFPKRLVEFLDKINYFNIL